MIGDIVHVDPATREVVDDGMPVWLPEGVVPEMRFEAPRPDDPTGSPGVPLGQFLPEMSMDEALSALKELIERLYMEALRTFTRHASPEEMATWPLMAEKAVACRAGDDEACRWLARQVPDIVAQTEGLADERARALWLAARVEAKKALYERVVAEAKAARAEGRAVLAARGFGSDLEVLAFAAELIRAAEQRLKAFMAEMAK